MEICCWFSSLLREVYPWVLQFPPLLKNQHFQIPNRSGTHGHILPSSYELLSAPWETSYNYNRMGWFSVELLKLIHSAIQWNLDLMKGQGNGKGPFSYILLLLGQNKSFIIPRTSLYRCLLYRGSTVVVKVNKIFQALVLYDWPNDNGGISTFSVCLRFVCFLIFSTSVIFKIDYPLKVMRPSRIEFPFLLTGVRGR